MSINIEFPVKQIPNYVLKVAQMLIENNFKAYLVGGAVRDLLIEKRTKDFDITTNATPEEIENIFPKSISTGAKFGNIVVIIEDEYGERFDVDVTTFRKEENYYGGRWPSNVEFSNEIVDDLSRRDFTINALAIDLKIVINDSDKNLAISEIIDPYGGINDLLNRQIKAVGDPIERFSEDGLRAFRACRLACELNFAVEEKTFEAIKTSTHIADKISMERIRDELIKMVNHSKTPSIGFRLLDDAGLLKSIIPELIEAKNIVQPEWHEEDVFNHSLRTMDLAEDSIKIAALLHDIGKIKTKTEDENGVHFFGHDKVGAELSEKILKRLRFSNSEIKRVSNLIRWHMFYYPSSDWRKENELEKLSEEKKERQNAFNHGWSDSAIRRFIKRAGGEEQIEDLIKLRIADASANTKSSFDPKEIQALENRIAEVRKKDMALKVSDLDITGNDLINIGIEKGPKIGIILNELLEKVIEEPLLNKKKLLLKTTKDLLNKK